MCESIQSREHLCSIENQKDVIDLDIPGTGLISQLKRWWYDLFLLSPADNRSRQYYMSSYSIQSARKIHFRYNRGTIHPFSKFRNTWDCIMLHALVIHMALFHFGSSIVLNLNIYLYYLLAIIEDLFIVDLYVNMRTGYVVKSTGRVVMRPAEIVIHYLTTNSFIHAMCATPLVHIMFLRLGNDIDNPLLKANLLVQALRFFSLVQIIKLFQLSAYWSKDRGAFRRTLAVQFVRIIITGLLVILKVLALLKSASAVYFVNTGSTHGTYLGNLVRDKYFSDKGEFYWICLTISRVSKSLFLYGYSLQENPQQIGQITMMLTYAVAFLFHFWAAVVVYNYVARDNSLDDHVSLARQQTLSVLRGRRLPDALHTKVCKYYDFKASNMAVIETRNTLLKSLPDVFKSQINMSCHRSLLTKIPYFAEWPPEVICGIVGLLQPEIYMDGDVVSSARHKRESLAIVEAGLLAAYSGGEEVGHLVDGDYFGVHALVGDHDPVRLSIVALSASVVLLLDKVSFQQFMELYPELFSEFESVLWSEKGQLGVAEL